MISGISRPKRLWVAALMNILVATTSVFAVAFLLLTSNPNIQEAIKLGLQATLLTLGTSVLLIVASILALLRIQSARWLMLGAALIFFGLLGYQSIALISSQGASLPHELVLKLWANIVRNSLEIIINAWALLSTTTAIYFSNNTLTHPSSGTR